MRAVALTLLSALYQGLCTYRVQQATDRGLTVQSRSRVRFKTLFGEVEIESPYLRHSRSGESARPMKDVLGVEGEHYSEAAQGAMVDFGSEKSFARAAVSFQEHYGWEVGRTTLRNRTLEAAREAETYIDLRLQQATRGYGQGITTWPAVDTMLVELDGCEIRTGLYMTAAEAGMSDRHPLERVRVENWRDVRTGLARPLDSRERLVVCRLDCYDEVCEQLFGSLCAGLDAAEPGGGARRWGQWLARNAVGDVSRGAIHLGSSPPQVTVVGDGDSIGAGGVSASRVGVGSVGAVLGRRGRPGLSELAGAPGARAQRATATADRSYDTL